MRWYRFGRHHFNLPVYCLVLLQSCKNICLLLKTPGQASFDRTWNCAISEVEVSFSREQEKRQRYDSSVPSLAMCCAVLELNPLPEGIEHRGLRVSLLDHFLRASGTNLPDLSRPYHGRKCDKSLLTAIVWAQAPGKGNTNTCMRNLYSMKDSLLILNSVSNVRISHAWNLYIPYTWWNSFPY